MSTEVRRIQFDFTSRDHGVGQDLDRIADSAEDTTGRLEGMGTTGAGASGKLTKGLGMVGAALGAAGIGVATFGALLAKGLDGEAATAKLAAQLGMTKTESERIGKDAGAIYSQAYGESMDEVKGAIKSVIQNMDGMRDASSASLRETTKRAMDLATVMGEDVSRVTAGVSQMMRTGLAKNSKEAFDIITRGAQLGANKSEDLLDTFEEYAVQFKAMGLSGKAAMGIIVQGLKGGARNADLVADTIKEFSIEAVAGADRVMGGFKSLGLNGREMSAAFAAGGSKSAKALDLVFDRLRSIEDPVKRNRVAIELFGTKAEDMGSALFKIDPSKATAGLGKLAGATDRAGKAMGDTMKAKITAFKRTLEVGVMNFIGGKVLPALESLGKNMRKSMGTGENAKMVKQLRDAWSQLQTVVKTKVIPAAKDLFRWWQEKIMPVIVKLHREVLKEAIKQFKGIAKEIRKNSGDFRGFAKAVGAVVEKVYKFLGPVLTWLYKVVLKTLGVWIRLSIKSYALFAREFMKVVDGIKKHGPMITRWWGNISKGATKMKDVAVGAFRNMVSFWLSAVNNIVKGAAKAFGWVPGLGGKLKSAARKVSEFKDDVNRALANVSKGRTATVTVKGIYGGGMGRRIPGLAKGGPVPAMWSGATEAYDSQPALLRVNEHVWTPEEVRAAGGHGQIMKLRKMAKQGLLQGFAGGGPVGFNIATKTTPKSVMNSTIWQPITESITGLLMAMARKLQKILKEMSGAGGVVAAARKMIGYPYSWGGGGKGGPSYGIGRGAGTYGFDCSGLTEYAWWRGARKSIGGVTYSQHPASSPIGRPKPGALGFSSSLGHVVLASDKPGYVIEAPYTGSFVREVRKSMPDWRWPKGAKFAAGGPVTKLGMDFVGGFAQREGVGMARLGGIAGDVGFRALGGPVTRGMPYVVGENGPEIVVPRQAGQVHRSGTTVVYQTINATIQVPPTANKAEIGRTVNECLAAYKSKGGKVVTG